MSEGLNTPFLHLCEIDRLCRSQAVGLPAQQQTQHSWSGVGFRLGERLLVAPMGEISEILHEPRYTSLPGVKSWVKGVANVRGRLLPVLDLCVYFEREPSNLRKQRRVLVVDHQDIFAGLVVDEVFGMQHFPVESFTDRVEGQDERLVPFVRGGFQRDQVWQLFRPHLLVQHQGFLAVSG